MGILIGTNRINIKRLERSTNTKITYSKTPEIRETIEKCKVTVRGKESLVKVALERIKQIGNMVSELVECPIEHVGKIIGKGGKTINKLKEAFGINIFSSLREINDTATTRFFKLLGLKNDIDKAKVVIEKLKQGMNLQKAFDINIQPMASFNPTTYVNSNGFRSINSNMISNNGPLVITNGVTTSLNKVGIIIPLFIYDKDSKFNELSNNVDTIATKIKSVIEKLAKQEQKEYNYEIYVITQNSK